MSNYSLLNDTFDNISFSDIGKHLNEDQHFKKPSTEYIFSNISKLNKNGNCIGNVTPSKSTRKISNSISFDDSQFFSESFTLPSTYKSYASDSEDLFGESGYEANLDVSEESAIEDPSTLPKEDSNEMDTKPDDVQHVLDTTKFKKGMNALEIDDLSFNSSKLDILLSEDFNEIQNEVLKSVPLTDKLLVPDKSKHSMEVIINSEQDCPAANLSAPLKIMANTGKDNTIEQVDLFQNGKKNSNFSTSNNTNNVIDSKSNKEMFKTNRKKLSDQLNLKKSDHLKDNYPSKIINTDKDIVELNTDKSNSKKPVKKADFETHSPNVDSLINCPKPSPQLNSIKSSSDIHEPITSNFDEPTKSNFHEPITSNFDKPSTSNFDKPTTSNFDKPTKSNFVEQITSNADEPNRSNSKQNTEKLTIESNLLADWGLPETVLQKYEKRSITSMFDWQVECLSNGSVLETNKNLVYSAPTSAGKTLVAEILALKTVLERKKKVLFILPFVSVVREKMFYFQDILGSSGIRVEGYMGSHNPPGDFKTVQVAICTIEKANSIVNRMLGEGSVSDIGCVVVDEMHLLGDSSRGYLLELMLTKIRYMSLKDESVNIQIIGMSATLPNLGLLAKWLNADLYTTNFRPIPLYEQCHVNGEIYNNSYKLERCLKPLKEIDSDTDNILQLCLETIQNSCSVLIFCPTKNWCENLSQQIAMAFWKLGNSDTDLGKVLRDQLDSESILELLEQLKRCPVGLDKILGKTAAFAVAFHHAGLTMDERDIIEGAFRSGALRVLVATSTLSSGVNLPARRVIIRTPMFHGKPISTLTYRQMIGRAGRMGKDTAGESVLICQKNDAKVAKDLMGAVLEPIESCLEGSGKLKRAILEVIASGVACSPEDVKLFTDCTLLAADDSQDNELRDCIKTSVDFLRTNEFIRLQELDDGTSKYVASSLGKACLVSSMPPEEGLALFTELEKARQCFVLETELHLIYLVTPYSACYQWQSLDWMHFLDLWEKLPTSMKRVGDLVGVKESYIVNATRGKIQSSTSTLFQRLLVHKRFYTALALQDLVNELPLNQVAQNFNCSRGMLQSLQQSASSFAGMVTSFSRQLGWSSVEILISQFQDRLQFGVNRDLLDLMRLPLLNGPRARALYNGGIESLVQLASADMFTLENILHRAIPFESEKGREGENEFEVQKRNKVRSVWITGMQGLTEREAAKVLINDARRFLQLEMGLTDAKWNDGNDISGGDGVGCDDKTNDNNGNSQVSTTRAEKLSLEPKLKIDIKSIMDVSVASSSEISQPKCIAEESMPVVKDCESTPKVSKETIIGILSSHGDETVVDSKSSFVDTSSSSVSINLELSPISSQKLQNSDNVLQEAIPHSPSNNILKSDGNDLSNKFSQSSMLFDLSNQSKFETSLKDDLNACVFSLNTEDVLFEDVENVIFKDNLKNGVNQLSDSKLDFENETFFQKAFVCSFDMEVETSSTKQVTNIVLDTNEKVKNSDNFVSQTSQLPGFGSQISSRLTRKRSRDEMDSEVVSEDDSTENKPSKKKKTKRAKPNKKTSLDALPECTLPDCSVPDCSVPDCSVPDCTLPNSSLPDCSFPFTNKSDTTPIDLTTIEIINVCDDSKLFDTFCKELGDQYKISLSIACSKVTENKPVIGRSAAKKDQSFEKSPDKCDKYVYKGRRVNGFSLSWGGNTAYYISLQDETYVKNYTKINQLKNLLGKPFLNVRMFECKGQVKVLKQCCGLDVFSELEDPKVGDWLLQPEEKEKNLQAMALKYTPEAVSLSQLAGSCKGVGSVGLDLHSAIDPRIRSSIEAVVCWYMVDALREAMAEQNSQLLLSYSIEMSSMLCLAKMEIDGIGVSLSKLQNLADSLKEQAQSLEKKAYQLAGRHFSFTSSTEVAKVLGMYRGKKVSTNKQVLEQNENPISDLILHWRKINSTLTKMVYPLLRLVQNGRIHGSSITHNATGRISMQEPNLQNVPRDFDFVNPLTNVAEPVSCRAAFIASGSNVLLSADYCQLELRLLSHLSQDPLLCSIMKSDVDVFKSVAAKWNGICESEVDDTLRQRAKQLCYGIIYGMGLKTLSEQLSITEEESAEFMKSFHNKYKGIKKYINETIVRCKELGYVETVGGRRRYLPHIHHQNLAIKSQAERQAVNTTVQGSAADIAKKAMVLIERNIQEKFKASRKRPRLVLHLHDELLYEVSSKYLMTTAKILKKSMEGSVQLSVPFPVKLKYGPSWGEMQELDL